MKGWGITLLVLGVSCTPMKTQPASEEATAVQQLDQATTTSAAPADSTVATAPVTPEAPWLQVRDVRIDPAGQGKRLTIALTRAPDAVDELALNGPPRLVLDLAGPRQGLGQLGRFPLSDELVSRVRVAPQGERLRVVLDLRRLGVEYKVRQEANNLVVDLGDTGDTPLASENPTLAPIVAEAAEAPPPPEAPPSAPPALTESPRDETPLAYTVSPTKPTRPLQMASIAERDRHGYSGQRISLDFKDADIQNVLRVLADVSKLNMIATDDVKGKVTLHLTDVPWDQALDLVLKTNRLEKTQEGNVVRISSVTRLKEERDALKAAMDAEKELEPLGVEYIRVNYARADESLIGKVKGVLTERGSVTFDDRTNTIIVRDIERGLLDAQQLIRELDTQSPQVLIEANIVEATEDFARGLGVQWGYQYNQGPAFGNATGRNFPGTVGFGGGNVLGSGSVPAAIGAAGSHAGVPFLADFPVPGNFGSGFGAGNGSALDLVLGSLDGAQSLNARLTALEEEGRGKVISRPRVITMNNVAATIQSLTILRVKLPSTGTVISTGTGSSAAGGNTATEKINTGITLVVTPQVSADGFVLMSIFAKSSQADFTKQVDNIPSEVSREANSNVLIRDGETVVLGGIFRNTTTDGESGLPYLRKVPVIGWAFKRLLQSNHKEELLVFLTPKVVANGTKSLPAAARLWEERRKGG